MCFIMGFIIYLRQACLVSHSTQTRAACFASEAGQLPCKSGNKPNEMSTFAESLPD